MITVKNNTCGVLFVLATCGVFMPAAYAGKGAVTNACVNLAAAPSSPITFKFSPVANNCMNNAGNTASLTTSKAGVSCTSVGYVEAKGSGWCAFEDSTWSLSYSSKKPTYTGSTQSTWETGTGITLNSYSPKTSVNLSPVAGSTTTVDWNNEGPIYIIFTPGATNLTTK